METIVIYLVLHSTPTHVNEMVMEWQGIPHLLTPSLINRKFFSVALDYRKRCDWIFNRPALFTNYLKMQLNILLFSIIYIDTHLSHDLLQLVLSGFFKLKVIAHKVHKYKQKVYSVFVFACCSRRMATKSNKDH